MEIVIGATPRVDPSRAKDIGQSGGGIVEARVLGVRAPRKREGTPPAGQRERRTGKQTPDPAGGRVMLLLIPEGHKLPRDVESGNYRVFVRFVPRNG